MKTSAHVIRRGWLSVSAYQLVMFRYSFILFLTGLALNLAWENLLQGLYATVIEPMKRMGYPVVQHWRCPADIVRLVYRSAHHRQQKIQARVQCQSISMAAGRQRSRGLRC